MNRPLLYIRIDRDLVLRQIEEEDVDAIFAQIDANRAYLREWLPWLDLTRTRADELTFIQRMNEQYMINGNPTAIIWYRRQAVGSIGYHPIDWANRRSEIGYWLAAGLQGRGLMTRACRALIDYGFDTLDLNKIEIRCATSNIRSCSIPQRLGFKQEGTVRQAEWLYDHFVDLVLYGLLASEWREQEQRE